MASRYVTRGSSTTCATALFALCVVAVASVTAAHAASDEIQVYLDDVREHGERGLELHVNYVQRGRTTPDYPGEQPPNHILRVTPEFSFGLGNGWDWGLYVPFSASSDTHSVFEDGLKLRLKHVVNNERPGASEFYGGNVEVSHSSRRTSPAYWHAEFRGIAGLRRGDWLFAMNPIVSTPLSSSTAESSVDFELDFKVGRDIGNGIALGVEHYAEFGPINKPIFGPDSPQTTFAIFEWTGRKYDINFGIGHGWTGASDRRVVKMIIGLPF